MNPIDTIYWESNVIYADHAQTIIIDVVPDDDGDTSEPDREFVNASIKKVENLVEQTILEPDDNARVTIHDDPIPTSKARLFKQERANPDAHCNCSCQQCVSTGTSVDLQTAAVSYSVLGEYTPSFISDGAHGAKPIFRAELDKPAGTWPDEVDISLEVKDDNDNVVLTTDAMRLELFNYTGSKVAFSIPVELDPTALETGSYRVSLSATDVATPPATTWDAETYYFFHDTYDSPIAPNWRFAFVDELVDSNNFVDGDAVQGGAAVFDGNDSVSWYAETAEPGEYTTPPESISTVVSAHGATSVTHRDGSSDWFYDDSGTHHTAGLHFKRVDANGNETSFSYNSDRSLARVTDPRGRVTSYFYGGDQLNGVTLPANTLVIQDFANRETWLAYDPSGPSMTVTYPDPDGSGPLASPQDVLTFNGDNTLQSIVKKSDLSHVPDQLTTLAYDVGGVALQIDRVVDATQTNTWKLNTYRDREATPSVDSTTGKLTWSPPSDAAGSNAPRSSLAAFENQATVTDGEGYTTTYTLDHRGRVVRVLDALQNEYTFQITTRDPSLEASEFSDASNDRGEIRKSILPDPDGPDPLTPLGQLVTEYEYDNLSNRLLEILPKLADEKSPMTRTWQKYVLGKARLYTNELGHRTVAGVDPGNGNLDYHLSLSVASGGRNPEELADVNFDGAVVASDAGFVINYLNQFGTTNFDGTATDFFLDSSGDGKVSPLDSLLVINHINSPASQPGATGGDNDSPRMDYGYTQDEPQGIPDGMIKETIRRTSRGEDIVDKYEYYNGLETDGASEAVKTARFGLVKSITYGHHAGGSSETVTFGYDEFGNVASVIDELGRETLFEYDALDRLIQVTTPDPDGLDVDGDLIDEEPLITTYDYDAFGNLVRVTSTTSLPATILGRQPPRRHQGTARITPPATTTTA